MCEWRELYATVPWAESTSLWRSKYRGLYFPYFACLYGVGESSSASSWAYVSRLWHTSRRAPGHARGARPRARGAGPGPGCVSG